MVVCYLFHTVDQLGPTSVLADDCIGIAAGVPELPEHLCTERAATSTVKNPPDSDFVVLTLFNFKTHFQSQKNLFKSCPRTWLIQNFKMVEEEKKNEQFLARQNGWSCWYRSRDLELVVGDVIAGCRRITLCNPLPPSHPLLPSSLSLLATACIVIIHLSLSLPLFLHPLLPLSLC